MNKDYGRNGQRSSILFHTSRRHHYKKIGVFSNLHEAKRLPVKGSHKSSLSEAKSNLKSKVETKM